MSRPPLVSRPACSPLRPLSSPHLLGPCPQSLREQGRFPGRCPTSLRPRGLRLLPWSQATPPSPLRPPRSPFPVAKAPSVSQAAAGLVAHGPAAPREEEA